MLPTATCFGELRGNREEKGRERGGGAREERRGRLGFRRGRGGFVGAGSRWERGPAAVARRAALGFRRGATVTKDEGGPRLPEGERRASAGLGCCALRAARS